MGFSGWNYFVSIKGDLCFTCLLLFVFTLLDLFIVDSSSSNMPRVKISSPQNPFSKLAAFVQQLHRLGPPLGRDVQTSSTNT